MRCCRTSAYGRSDTLQRWEPLGVAACGRHTVQWGQRYNSLCNYDHRALTRAVTVSVVTVPLIEGSYLRQWKQRSAIRLTWSANVSCWSMVTPRQVTVRRSTADPLTTRTDVSILANRSLRQILEVNCVFRCKASVCLTTSMQWPTSSIHDIKRSKIALRLSDDECSYNWVSLAYEWPVTPWRAAMTSKSAVYRRNRTVEQVPCDTSYR